MKKRNYKKKEIELVPESILNEAMSLLEQTRILGATVDWQSMEVDKYFDTYTDEKLETMGWEEREEIQRKGEELYGRLKVSVEDLGRLNTAYDKIREKVNKIHGHEVMKSIDKKVKWGENGLEIGGGTE